MKHAPGKSPYQLTSDEVLDLLDSAEQGLSSKEAGARLVRDGENKLTAEEGESFIARIVGELKSPLAFVLLCAGIVTTFIGEYVDSTVIFIALIINIFISLYQQGRADKAFERLRDSQVATANVFRDGARKEIAATALVKGDIIAVDTGVNIPADARLIWSSNLEVNESALTGEWIDVTKADTHLPNIIPLSERKNMLWMGTLVTGGSGRAVVTATGKETEFGKIAASLNKRETEPTPLERGVADIARFLSYIVLIALVGIFVLGVIRELPFTDLLLISIAIAVAAIPEGLPAAVTVTLAIGMEAILKRGGLVRNLLAAETLGSTTVILTDKTGTLTKAQMRVARVITLGTLELESNAKETLARMHEAHGDERDALEFAALASDAYIEKQKIGGGGTPAEDVVTNAIVRGRPVERAVVEAALESGLDQTQLLLNYPRISFLPFESRYRVAISLNHIRGLLENRLHITGAPEFLLAAAHSVYLEGKQHPLTEETRKRFAEALVRFAGEGMRVVGVAFHDTTKKHLEDTQGAEGREELLKGVVFVGFILFHDPLREDAAAAITEAKLAGARVIMATGDNPETARTIAKECGIWKTGDSILTGEAIEAFSDDALVNALHHTTVFARMTPESKMRVVRLLIAQGEVVAMTGDGVNDAPALRAASIGVALGSGTEVAKEASDLVLLNNSFSIIVAAIEEGRRVIDNLRKIVVYLLSTSGSEIIVVGGALMIGLPLPLLPAQILWTNILSEGFMNFSFAFEPKESDLMRRDPRVVGAKQLVSRRLMGFVVTVGLLSGLLLLALYWYLVTLLGLQESDAQTLMFTALNLTMVFSVFSFKDLRAPIWKTRFFTNPYLFASIGFSFFGLLVAFMVEPITKILRLAPFDPMSHLGLLAGIILTNIALVEVAKFLFFPRKGGV